MTFFSRAKTRFRGGFVCDGSGISTLAQPALVMRCRVGDGLTDCSCLRGTAARANIQG